REPSTRSAAILTTAVAVGQQDVIELRLRELVPGGLETLHQRIDHPPKLVERRKATLQGRERLLERRDQSAPRVPATNELRITSRQCIVVETMLLCELGCDAKHGLWTESLVFGEHQRRLEVIVEGNDASAVFAKARRRRLPIEMDQDAPHDRTVLDALR